MNKPNRPFTLFGKTLEQHGYEWADHSFGLFKSIVLSPIRIFNPDFGKTEDQLIYEKQQARKKAEEPPLTKWDTVVLIGLYLLVAAVLIGPYLDLLK